MFNASRLAVARKRRHLSKKELANESGVSALTITRLENRDTVDPERETVQAIASALAFPIEFLYLDDCEELDTDSVSFRSLSSLTARQRDAALSAGAIGFEVHEWVAARFDLPEVNLLDLRDEEPRAAAEALRSHWGLGARPVEAMVKLLESKGVRVFTLAEQHKNVDAFSCWNKGVPFVFLNTFKSAERSRFDASHELAHLCLHKHAGPRGRDLERDADAFASAFLIHRGDLISSLPRVTSLEQLVVAKKRWGVSVAALTRAAFEARLISDWHYRDLCKQMSMLGYRSKEPSGREQEKSTLWRLVFAELWRDGITRDTIAKELHLPLSEIEALVGSLVVQENLAVSNRQTKHALRIV
jgi:Zn-dependent peptidase ImmA (M78 family)/DNA-binding XRE family transcriptional regulator